jgi:BolA family transcriptional regulator, general stress-responsive regulator
MSETFVSEIFPYVDDAGPVAAAMKSELATAFTPAYLRFENESNNHGGPATDSHFKLILVAPEFEGLRSVQRHQLVYKVLASFLQASVHALSLHLFTAAEWDARNKAVADSPACLGGSKEQSE